MMKKAAMVLVRHSKDTKYVFYKGKVIKGADAESFNYNEEKYVFSDKNHIYDKGKSVERNN